MTFGEHLASYRRAKGMTQQELGDYLCISAQAISKWENNLSEPDVGTIKKLAALYEVPTSVLLDYEEAATASAEPAASTATATMLHTVGFCTSCGITVTEENVGERTPKVLCRDCVVARDESARAAREASERSRAEREAGERRAAAENVSYMKRRLLISHVVAILIGIPVLIYFLTLGYSGKIEGVEGPLVIAVSAWLGYSVFSFVNLLFYEGAVRDVLFFMATKSFQWPGLIFTFDLDGFLWLIGMKILFAILGFLGGVLFAVLGVVIAITISPFIYPFKLVKHVKCIASGDIATFKNDFDL